MRGIIVATALFVTCLIVDVHSDCSRSIWDFNKKGYSRCPSYQGYMNGLIRKSNKEDNDDITNLEGAECCRGLFTYQEDPTLCRVADWKISFDSTNKWNNCRKGFFLSGLYKSDGKSLHNIEYGKCCKPAKHPYYWGTGACYNQDIRNSFDKKGLSQCKPGYYITGLYRGNCNKLSCIQKLRCCEMHPDPPPAQSLANFKTLVMDYTMHDLALLAHFLGYGWCAGCRADYVGEDFRRNGNSWEADKKGPCDGYMADKRLKIHYGNFKFDCEDVKFGKPLIQSLQPTLFDSGKVVNNDSTSVTQTILREIRSVRKVTHTVTNSWKKAHELGIEISYTPPPTGGFGGKVNYNFNYETSETTTDSTQKEQYNSIKISTEKTVAAHSAAKWQLMLSKTRTTVSYTATILVHFSAELDGFLRWGGGYDGDNTNYHYKHRGSGSRPTYKYRFGDKSDSFYKALKKESTQDLRPWLWTDMMNRHPFAEQLINNLVDKGRYKFILTGQFEDVVGQNADVQWHTIPADDQSDQELMDVGFPVLEPKVDPPRAFPSPPKVIITKEKYKEDKRPIEVGGSQNKTKV